MTSAAEVKVRAAVARRGPLPFSEVVELALYDQEAGFYAVGGQAGRRADFLTSPEVGPLFGAVVARALDAWWDAAGQPDRWTLVEAGAGPGTLARAVRAAAPRSLAGADHVLVERSAAQRALHPQGVASQPELPVAGSGPCVVLANELLDNLPFDLAERTAGGWSEVRVDVDDDARPVERLVPLDDAAVLDRLAGGAGPGARVPIQRSAQAWLAAALALAGGTDHGWVVALDYASTTADLAARPADEWLRTYRHHERGGPPLSDLGGQDVTCEVAVDQLAEVAPPDADRSQADWLRAHGIEDLVEEGRRTWQERASIGDLAAVRARSRVTEAEALLDPAGLGAFRVLEWRPGGPVADLR